MSRNGIYRNGEGYYDPTAGAAMSRVMKEYRQARKAEWEKENEIKSRPRAYVVSRYAGDVERNVKMALNYCRYLIGKKKIPIASHLLYPQMLNDNDPGERRHGIMFGLSLLACCDEVWVFVIDDVISDGMRREIEEAKRLDKYIYYCYLTSAELGGILDGIS